MTLKEKIEALRQKSDEMLQELEELLEEQEAKQPPTHTDNE